MAKINVISPFFINVSATNLTSAKTRDNHMLPGWCK